MKISLTRIVLGLFCLAIWTNTALADVPSVVLRDVGSYNLPDGSCAFSIKNSPKGNFKQLSFPTGKGQSKDVDDLTGVAFSSERYLVFTIGPMYGHAGIFLYNCVGKSINQILAPSHVTLAYPAGTDYYMLQKVDHEMIYFYYAPDVDQINLANFEEKDNLYEVHDNGALLRKSTGKQ
jgi:hypothetical protein